jgi:hypothetical protein
MEAEQLHPAVDASLSKVLRVQARGNELKVLGPTKSRLVVQ